MGIPRGWRRQWRWGRRPRNLLDDRPALESHGLKENSGLQTLQTVEQVREVVGVGDVGPFGEQHPRPIRWGGHGGFGQGVPFQYLHKGSVVEVIDDKDEGACSIGWLR